MNKLIICVGISGSGKSTWSTNYIRENPNTLRINRDDIRKTLVGSLDGYYQRKDFNVIEFTINTIENGIFSELAHNKNDVIIDNTNLKQSYINRWINLSEVYKYSIQFKLFDISLEDAQKRVGMRDFPEFFGYDDTKVEYIEKQFEQYKQIKKYLETNHKNQII